MDRSPDFVKPEILRSPFGNPAVRAAQVAAVGQHQPADQRGAPVEDVVVEEILEPMEDLFHRLHARGRWVKITISIPVSDPCCYSEG